MRKIYSTIVCLALLAAFFAVPRAQACDYGAALGRFSVPVLPTYQLPVALSASCGQPAALLDYAAPAAAFNYAFQVPTIGYAFQAPAYSYGTFQRSFALGIDYGRQGVPAQFFDRGFAVGLHAPVQRSFRSFQTTAFAAPVLPVARVPQITQKTRTVTTTTTRQR
jgi:hypothetical protein